jgi:phosphatidate cytidylyltransferase
MADTVPLAAPRARGHVLVGLALGAAALAALLAGRVTVSVFIAIMVVAAYVDLRKLLAPWGHLLTFILGAGGVLGFLWTGYTGRLELVASAGAALVLALLVTRVLLYEVSAGMERSDSHNRSEGTTADVAATLGAAGVAGVLGAHLLLIRSVPRFGFRGLLVFGLMILCNDAVAFFVGRWRGRHKVAPRRSPQKTWEGAVAGFCASVVVGLVAGATLDPPFDLRSGLALGAAMGLLAPTGDLAFSTIKRSAGVKGSGVYLGPLGGALDSMDSVLFAAPAFYWALRTLAL